MTISLAFLAPDLVKAAIDGRLPQGTGIARSHRPARRMVEATRDARLPNTLTELSNQVSAEIGLPGRETRFRGAETKAPERPRIPIDRLQRPIPRRNSRQVDAIRNE
jgi:hypothetical protein